MKDHFIIAINLKRLRYQSIRISFQLKKKHFYTHQLKAFLFHQTYKNLKKDGAHQLQNLIVFQFQITIHVFQYIYNESILLYHSKEGNETSIVFACRDIEKVTIPSNVKIIESSTFSECQKLNFIEFSPNSILVSICDHSFR